MGAIDIDDAIKMREGLDPYDKKHTLQKIADKYGVSRSAVSQALNNKGDEFLSDDELEVYIAQNEEEYRPETKPTQKQQEEQASTIEQEEQVGDKDDDKGPECPNCKAELVKIHNLDGVDFVCEDCGKGFQE